MATKFLNGLNNAAVKMTGDGQRIYAVQIEEYDFDNNVRPITLKIYNKDFVELESVSYNTEWTNMFHFDVEMHLADRFPANENSIVRKGVISVSAIDSSTNFVGTEKSHILEIRGNNTNDEVTLVPTVYDPADGIISRNSVDISADGTTFVYCVYNTNAGNSFQLQDSVVTVHSSKTIPVVSENDNAQFNNLSKVLLSGDGNWMFASEGGQRDRFFSFRLEDDVWVLKDISVDHANSAFATDFTGSRVLCQPSTNTIAVYKKQPDYTFNLVQTIDAVNDHFLEVDEATYFDFAGPSHGTQGSGNTVTLNRSGSALILGRTDDRNLNYYDSHLLRWDGVKYDTVSTLQYVIDKDNTDHLPHTYSMSDDSNTIISFTRGLYVSKFQSINVLMYNDLTSYTTVETSFKKDTNFKTAFNVNSDDLYSFTKGSVRSFASTIESNTSVISDTTYESQLKYVHTATIEDLDDNSGLAPSVSVVRGDRIYALMRDEATNAYRLSVYDKGLTLKTDLFFSDNHFVFDVNEDGSVVVVGSRQAFANKGGLGVYKRISGDTYTSPNYINDGADLNDQLGYSVAINASGDTIVASSYAGEKIHKYQETETNVWTEIHQQQFTNGSPNRLTDLAISNDGNIVSYDYTFYQSSNETRLYQAYNYAQDSVVASGDLDSLNLIEAPKITADGNALIGATIQEGIYRRDTLDSGLTFENAVITNIPKHVDATFASVRARNTGDLAIISSVIFDSRNIELSECKSYVLKYTGTSYTIIDELFSKIPFADDSEQYATVYSSDISNDGKLAAISLAVVTEVNDSFDHRDYYLEAFEGRLDTTLSLKYSESEVEFNSRIGMNVNVPVTNIDTTMQVDSKMTFEVFLGTTFDASSESATTINVNIPMVANTEVNSEVNTLLSNSFSLGTIVENESSIKTSIGGVEFDTVISSSSEFVSDHFIPVEFPTVVAFTSDSVTDHFIPVEFNSDIEATSELESDHDVTSQFSTVIECAADPIDSDVIVEFPAGSSGLPFERLQSWTSMTAAQQTIPASFISHGNATIPAGNNRMIIVVLTAASTASYSELIDNEGSVMLGDQVLTKVSYRVGIRGPNESTGQGIFYATESQIQAASSTEIKSKADYIDNNYAVTYGNHAQISYTVLANAPQTNVLSSNDNLLKEGIATNTHSQRWNVVVPDNKFLVTTAAYADRDLSKHSIVFGWTQMTEKHSVSNNPTGYGSRFSYKLTDNLDNGTISNGITTWQHRSTSFQRHVIPYTYAIINEDAGAAPSPDFRVRIEANSEVDSKYNFIDLFDVGIDATVEVPEVVFGRDMSFGTTIIESNSESVYTPGIYSKQFTTVSETNFASSAGTINKNYSLNTASDSATDFSVTKVAGTTTLLSYTDESTSETDANFQIVKLFDVAFENKSETGFAYKREVAIGFTIENTIEVEFGKLRRDRDFDLTSESALTSESVVSLNRTFKQVINTSTEIQSDIGRVFNLGGFESDSSLELLTNPIYDVRLDDLYFAVVNEYEITQVEDTTFVIAQSEEEGDTVYIETDVVFYVPEDILN